MSLHAHASFADSHDGHRPDFDASSLRRGGDHAELDPPAPGFEFLRGAVRALLGLKHAGSRDVAIRYELQGPAGAPCVVVLGGISAHRHVVASPAAPEPGWWETQAGPGRALDTSRYRLLSIDWLCADGTLDLRIDVADQAEALAAVLDALGIERLAALVGCSYGASVGLHFAARHPHRLDHLIAIAGAHRAHPWAVAQRSIQRAIVRLGGDEQQRRAGLSLARQLAMLGYRTRDELGERFEADAIADEQGLAHPCLDWLEHAGRSYVARTPVSAFLRLSESLDLNTLDPASVHVPCTVVAVEEDQLVPVELCAELARGIAAPTALRRIASRFGHDAFLKEDAAFDALLRDALEVPA